jgi:hypothetical protein
MFPAMSFERLAAFRSQQHDDRLAGAEFHDPADPGDGNPGDLAGKARCGRSGEEQFVVLSAVQGLGEGRGVVDGQQSGIDLSSYAGLLADVSEVGRQAVAEVDGSGGGAVLYKPKALADAGLGIEVRGQQGFELPGNSERVRAGLLGFA